MARNKGLVLLGISAAIALIVAILSLRELYGPDQAREVRQAVAEGVDQLSQAREKRLSEQQRAKAVGDDIHP